MCARASDGISSRIGPRRGVAQFGSAFGWGPKGRWFKSSRPDNAEAASEAVPTSSPGFGPLGKWLRGTARGTETGSRCRRAGPGDTVTGGDQRIRAVDLFSGCGGLSVGFERSGTTLDYRVVMTLDNHVPSVKVFNRNHPANPVPTGRLADVTWFVHPTEVRLYYLAHLDRLATWGYIEAWAPGPLSRRAPAPSDPTGRRAAASRGRTRSPSRSRRRPSGSSGSPTCR